MRNTSHSGLRRQLGALVGASALGLLAVAGSGATALGSAPDGTGTDDTAPDGTGPGQTWDVSMITPRSFNLAHLTLVCAIDEIAADAGLNMRYYEQREFTVPATVSLIQQAIAASPDAIITNAPDSKAMDEDIRSIGENGIRSIVYDSVSDDETVADAQITTDVYQIGQLAADEMADATGGEGQILIVDLAPGVTSTNQRAQGFIDRAAEEYPDFEILETQYDNLDPAKDAQIVSATLARYPDLAGIFFTYDNAAVGGMPTLIDAGKAGEVKVVSNDADPILVEYLRDGYISALFPHNMPELAQAIVDRTVQALNGEEIDPRTLYVPPTVVTPDNVDDPSVAGSLYREEC